MAKRANGEGSVTSYKTKSGKRWRFEIILQVNGRPYPFRKGGFKTKLEADGELSTLKTQHRSGGVVEPQKITVREWLEKVAERREKAGKSLSTMRNEKRYRQIIGSYPIADRPLQQVSPMEVQSLYDALGAVYQDSHLKHIHQFLNLSYNEAERVQLVTRNPCRTVKPVVTVAAGSTDEDATRVWEAEEIRRFLAFCSEGSKARWGRLFHFYLLTGLRRGEALALLWEDIDFANKKIRVSKSLDDKRRVGKTKTREVRSVPLNAELIQLLEAQKEWQSILSNTLHAKWANLGVIFSNTEGNHLYPREANERFLEVVQLSGVPNITLHGLRHTYATLLLKKGIDVRIVSKLLGHAKIDFTMNVYAHVLKTELDNLPEFTTDFLLGQSGAKTGVVFN